MNPNPRAVVVEVERLAPGGPIEEFTIEASRTKTVKLGGSKPFGISVHSRGGPMTAAVIGPRGSMSGVPID